MSHLILATTHTRPYPSARRSLSLDNHPNAPQPVPLAQLTALYSALLYTAYQAPTHFESCLQNTQNLQDAHTRGFSSNDLPLHHTISPPQLAPPSQATTEVMPDSGSDVQSDDASTPSPSPTTPPLTSSAFWALAASHQDLTNFFNTIESIPLHPALRHASHARLRFCEKWRCKPLLWPAPWAAVGKPVVGE